MKQSTLNHLQLGLVVVIAAIYIFLTLFVHPAHADAQELCPVIQPAPQRLGPAFPEENPPVAPQMDNRNIA